MHVRESGPGNEAMRIMAPFSVLWQPLQAIVGY